MTQLWQIAAGEAGRRYDDLFLKHDVMLCGPGNPGRFEKKTYAEAVAKGKIAKPGRDCVRRFVSDVNVNDVVLLRRGHKVVSIGLVASDYSYDERFDDVYGWNVAHSRRVSWQRALEPDLERMQKRSGSMFGHMKQISTFTAVHSKSLRNQLDGLLSKCQLGDLASLPDNLSPPMDSEQLASALFAKGLAFENIVRVRQAIEKQRALSNWYRENKSVTGRPTESELVTHIVVPLLQSLGWSEQFLAVEWNRVDLAVFRETPTDASSCVLVCEAKGLWHGLQSALNQAVKYVEKLKLVQCRRILLTNGRQLYLYGPGADDRFGIDSPLIGYVNLLGVREKYVVPKEVNSIDTLIELTPNKLCR